MLAPSLSADTFSDRRDALIEKVTDGIIIVWGEKEESYEFRGQRNDFLYLTGLDQPDAVLVLIPGGKRLYSRGISMTEILYLPERDQLEESWTGEKLGPGDRAEVRTGIDNVFDITNIDNHIMIFLRNEKSLNVSARLADPGNPLTKDQLWINSIRDTNPFITIKDLSPHISSMRQRKTAGELDKIRKAIDITRQAILEAMKMVAPGIYEYQVEATVQYYFRFLGGDGQAFDPIVGSGPNSTILHYFANERKMEEGDILVLDVGAQYAGYDSDISRTLPVSGKYTEEQAEIYDIVLEAQRLAIEKIKPGALYREDIDATARVYIADNGYGEYFSHGTGHFVGLDTHDSGEFDIPLEPGMVITVEPGIYIPEKNIGVRIEDMVLVTEEGHEVLSREVPRTREEIEKIMQ
jgi:Xaa-Pro aminopeptidase